MASDFTAFIRDGSVSGVSDLRSHSSRLHSRSVSVNLSNEELEVWKDLSNHKLLSTVLRLFFNALSSDRDAFMASLLGYPSLEKSPMAQSRARWLYLYSGYLEAEPDLSFEDYVASVESLPPESVLTIDRDTLSDVLLWSQGRLDEVANAESLVAECDRLEARLSDLTLENRRLLDRVRVLEGQRSDVGVSEDLLSRLEQALSRLESGQKLQPQASPGSVRSVEESSVDGSGVSESTGVEPSVTDDAQPVGSEPPVVDDESVSSQPSVSDEVSSMLAGLGF